MALENLRIIRLEAENVKRIKAVEITPKGDLVEIVGKNGHGKTSVLDSILWAMAGEKPIQWKPIREGEQSAHITLDLGNDEGLQLRVVRNFHAQEDGSFTTTLKVTTADGMRPRGEQTLLNTIVGALSFDPAAFVRSKDEDQVKILKGLIPGVDFDAIARKRKAAYDTRTEVNRDEKRLRASVASILVGDDVPDEEQDTSELMEKIRNVGTAAREYEQEKLRRSNRMQEASDLEDEVFELESEVKEMEAKIADIRNEMSAKRGEIESIRDEVRSYEPLPEPADSSALSDQLAELQDINRQVLRKMEREKIRTEADEKLKESEALTATIEALDKEVVLAVERAKLPVRGLELRDERVFLRGVPFNQGSDAEQLRASIGLGMAMSPKLRVLRIRDGSLFDDEAMEIIREVAEEEGFQIWIERVGTDGGPEAVIMENGEVKNG